MHKDNIQAGKAIHDAHRRHDFRRGRPNPFDPSDDHGTNKPGENETVDDFFLKQKYNTKDFEFDRIFINGDNNLENLKVDEDVWKVSLIEEEFHKRMFDVGDF